MDQPQGVLKSDQPLAPVSVVVPVFNEAQALPALLEALRAQHALPAEVLIADNGSSDGSAAVVRRWWAEHGWAGARLEVLELAPGFPGAGRNAGVEASTQPWIAFLDCGTLPEPGWLATLLGCAGQERADAVLGSCCFDGLAAWPKAFCALSYGVGTCRPALPGSLFRRTIFRAAGGFRSDLRAAEDTLWLDAVGRTTRAVKACATARVLYRRFPVSVGAAARKWFEYERHASRAGAGGWSRMAAAAAPLVLYGLLATNLLLGAAAWTVYFALRGVLDPIRRSARSAWWRPFAVAALCAPVAAVVMDTARALGCVAGLFDRLAGAQRRNRRSPPRGFAMSFVLWVVMFSYATSIALIFQKALLPHFPGLHAGQGLLEGDAIYFHTLALELAERIGQHGWGEWRIYPTAAAAGNVAILAALYALFPPDPSLIVPVNAAIHATSGVLLYWIGRQLLPGGSGRMGGLIAAALFMLFPSSLNWYGQVHKDGYAIAGLLLVVWTWVRVLGRPTRPGDAITTIVATAVAVALIGLVRPYQLLLLTAVMTAILGVLACYYLVGRRIGMRALFLCAASVLLVGIAAAAARWLGGVEERYGLDQNYATTYLRNWNWSNSKWLPAIVDAQLEAVAQTRLRFAAAGAASGAGSMIDTERLPASAGEMSAYLPRALQIGLFAPFPNTWLEGKGPAQWVALAETLVWYLLAPGVVLCLWYAWGVRVAVVLFFALAFVGIYGFSIPNVGTLYRIRAPFLFLLILMGAIGWFEFVRRRLPGALRESIALRLHGEHILVPEVRVPTGFTNEVNRPSVAVGALAALGYLGFFLRDAILARWYGTGTELDAYYVAFGVPSLLVAVISMPLGTMITAQYLEVREERSRCEAQRFVSRVIGAYALAMLALVAVLAIGAGATLALAGWNLQADAMRLAHTLFYWTLPILFLSGFVIIGNGLLNALGSYAVPAAAQLVVPALSIASLWGLGYRLGVLAAVLGMLAGQAINLGVVAATLARRGVSVAPVWPAGGPLYNAPGQYGALAAAAALDKLAAPVNLGMASMLGQGAVAALALGTKIVTFATGMIGAVTVAVILPRFASRLARRDLGGVQSELRVLLLMATVLTIPLALLIVPWSEELVRFAFASGAFDDASAWSVSRVMANGVIQIPFVTVGLLVLKFAIAMRSSGKVFIGSLLVLAVNIGLNGLLMEHSGVAGIALANTIAVAFATVVVLLLCLRQAYVSWVDVMLLALSWMLYSTAVICLHYGSYAGTLVSVLALLVVFGAHWFTLSPGIRASRS
jgi:peptidoglycan biosynthesis protein MviN/MurJ (putative lipid II flippase)